MFYILEEYKLHMTFLFSGAMFSINELRRFVFISGTAALPCEKV
jgi:hypothetical protein